MPSIFSPLRTDEILQKQNYKKSSKNIALLDTSKSTENNGLKLSSSNDISNKKKSKARKSPPGDDHEGTKEHKKKHKNKDKSEVNDTDTLTNDVDLLGTPVKVKSKSKKDKKSSKPKSSSKSTRNTDSKSGYEEALGISTPSKEIYWCDIHHSLIVCSSKA